jgi:hypothetical protein
MVEWLADMLAVRDEGQQELCERELEIVESFCFVVQAQVVLAFCE